MRIRFVTWLGRVIRLHVHCVSFTYIYVCMYVCLVTITFISLQMSIYDTVQNQLHDLNLPS